MTAFPTPIVNYIRSIGMTEITVIAYLQLDESFNLLSWEGQPLQLGVLDLTVGQPITEQLFFLEGILPISNTLILRFVSLSENCYAHVHLISNENGTYVLLFDATSEYEHQQKMHQQANESKLLTYQKNQLLDALEAKNDNLLPNKIEPTSHSTRLDSLTKMVKFVFNFFRISKTTYK